MAKTILVVDDKANVRNMVRDYLTGEGYRVVIAANGRDALYVARQEKPDLILLDIMMPEMAGYDFIRAYQKECATPIILLTAKTDEADKALGLELGADDYITKPFSLKELVARIHAVLRRSERAIADSKPLIVGEVCLNKETYSVTAYGAPVHLTQSEFELLYTWPLAGPLAHPPAPQPDGRHPRHCPR